MEIPISPDTQSKLDRMAAEKGTTTAALVRDAIEKFANYDEWFAAQVQKGIEQIERGEWLSHEDVMTRINQIIEERQNGR